MGAASCQFSCTGPACSGAHRSVTGPTTVIRVCRARSAASAVPGPRRAPAASGSSHPDTPGPPSARAARGAAERARPAGPGSAGRAARRPRPAGRGRRGGVRRRARAARPPRTGRPRTGRRAALPPRSHPRRPYGPPGRAVRPSRCRLLHAGGGPGTGAVRGDGPGAGGPDVVAALRHPLAGAGTTARGVSVRGGCRAVAPVTRACIAATPCGLGVRVGGGCGRPCGPRHPGGEACRWSGAGGSSGPSGPGRGSYPQSASSAAPAARPVSTTRPSSQTRTVRAVMLRCVQPCACSTRSAVSTSARDLGGPVGGQRAARRGARPAAGRPPAR